MRPLSVVPMFLLHTAILVLALADEKAAARPEVDKAPPTPQEEGDSVGEPDGLGWCKEDKDVAEVCIVCAQLPGPLALPPDRCCTDEDVLESCKACLEDPLNCLGEEADTDTSGEDAIPVVDKRFGTLFLGRRNYGVDYPEKRFGTLNLGNYGKRSEEEEEEEEEGMDKRWGSLGMSKRFGTLNLGSYFNKRYGMLGMGTPYLGYLSKGYGNMGKRFGTLNLGGGKYRFGKRYGTLNMGKRYGTLNMGKRWGTLNMGKRWGTLNMGKRWGTLNMGKRWGTLNMGQKRDLLEDSDLDKRYGTLNLGKRYGTLNMGKRYGTLNMGGGYGSMPSLGKRYGTLNMGNSYGFYPHKRKEYVPYNGNIGIDMRKRYGRLFMGRYGGKRLGSENEIQVSDIKK